eukprot:m.18550 g.18550  ORF g.18550 m.18550 type:complete len:662 (+) comp3604_c0_seq1:204-2189(+)
MSHEEDDTRVGDRLDDVIYELCAAYLANSTDATEPETVMVSLPSPPLPAAGPFRTVSAAAPNAANTLRRQWHAEAAGLQRAHPETRAYIANSQYDFTLPRMFHQPRISTAHRDSLVGHDALALSTTRILDLFDTLPGSQLVPLGTDADGDCLLHSAAVAMWGVHWERSGPESGEKASPHGPNVFRYDTSPMRTAIMVASKKHRQDIFPAWCAEFLSRVAWQVSRFPDTVDEDEARVRNSVRLSPPSPLPHTPSPPPPPQPSHSDHSRHRQQQQHRRHHAAEAAPSAAEPSTTRVSVAMSRADGASQEDFKTSMFFLARRFKEDARLLHREEYQDGTREYFNQYLGSLHVCVLAIALRRPIIVYSNTTVGTVVEGFGGIYLPLGLPQASWVTARPLLLHGGRQHFTALVAVEDTTTRIPLFVPEPTMEEGRADERGAGAALGRVVDGGGRAGANVEGGTCAPPSVSPLPLRFFQGQPAAWHGLSTAWATDDGGPDALAAALGARVVQETVGGRRVHYLDMSAYPTHRPPRLARTIAQAYLDKLRRTTRLAAAASVPTAAAASVTAIDRRSRKRPSVHDTELTAEAYWDTLHELDQALLMSVSHAPDTHTRQELHDWLQTHGAAQRLEYRDATLTPATSSMEMDDDASVPTGSKRVRMHDEDG